MHCPGAEALAAIIFSSRVVIAQLSSVVPPSEETRHELALQELDWAWGDVKRLARAEVQVERRYSVCTTPYCLYPRQCYPKAIWYVEQHRIKDMWLLMGETASAGYHFWVELPERYFVRWNLGFFPLSEFCLGKIVLARPPIIGCGAAVPSQGERVREVGYEQRGGRSGN